MKTKTALLRLAGSLLIALFGALPACQKSAPTVEATPAAAKIETTELVAAAERSRHFAAVSRQLELGGTLYGYADVDGDVVKLADSLQQFLGSVPGLPPPAGVFLNQDFAKIGATLGLTDVKALGLSSVPDAAGGFRNRLFLFTPDGRHGLLAGLGGAAGPFQHPRLAPADADFFTEGEFDLPVIYAAVKEVTSQVGGTTAVNAMEAFLKMSPAPGGVTGLAVINSLKGRLVMLGRLDEKQTVTLPLPTPTPVVVPAFSLLIRIDGLGAALVGALDQQPMLEATTEGAMKVYGLKAPLPVDGLQPVLAVEGGVLWIATTREFLAECHDRKAGLDQEPGFQKALAAVGGEGNSLSYVSPRLFARLRQLADLNPQADPGTKQALALIARQAPDLKQPVIAVSANLPDGILMRAHSYHSLKQEVATAAFYNPLTLGMMAAMTIPAFQKVQTNSQEMQIKNNLRQLAAGADIYYLENGVNTVTYDKLVGPEKEKYVKSITPVAGEDYTKLQFKEGQPLRVTTADGRTVVLEEPGNGVQAQSTFSVMPPPAPGKAATGPAGGVLAEIQAIRSSSASFTANRHRGFGTDMANLETAARAFAGNGGNPTPAQIHALQAALDTAIQLATEISMRATETAAAKSTALGLAGRLKALKDNVSQQWPGE
jgi:hypothetical protein